MRKTDSERQPDYLELMRNAEVYLATYDPMWRRRAAARMSAPPPAAPWQVDPWGLHLTWPTASADAAEFHQQFLGRVAGRGTLPAFDGANVLDLVRGVVREQQARRGDEGRGVSLREAVGLAEKVSIEPPARLEAVEPIEFEQWATQDYHRRWFLWCLDADLPGPTLDRYDLDFLEKYTQAYNALAQYALRAQHEGKSLRRVLEERLPRDRSLPAPYPWPDDGSSLESRDEWMRRNTFTLPRDWRKRTITERGEFAELLLAARDGVGITAVKERLARERTLKGLALTWYRYRRWLAAHPAAVAELARALGLSIYRAP